MSLLDDALKKRQQELESPDIPSHLVGLQENKAVEKTQPKKLFLTLLALLVLFSGGLSFAILKYSTSQIRPKVISIKPPEKEHHVVSQQTNNLTASTEKKHDAKKTKSVSSVQTASNKNTLKSEEKQKEEEINEHINVAKGHRDTKNTVVPEKKMDTGGKEKVKPTPRHARYSPSPNTRTSVTQIKKPGSVDVFFITAARYQRDGRLREAISIYKKILERYPKNRKARLNLAAAYLQVGQVSAAHAILEKLYRDYPNDPRVLLDYAIVMTKIGRLNKALRCLLEAEKRGGPRFEVLLNKGIVFRKMGKLREAIRTYDEARSLKPGDPKLIYNQAIAYDTAGLYQLAINHYRSFLENPEHDSRKDNLIRERLQQLYAYLNHMNQQKITGQ